MYTGAVDIVDRAFELGVWVVTHFVTADAEFLGVGVSHCRGAYGHQQSGTNQGNQQYADGQSYPGACTAPGLQLGPPFADHVFSRLLLL
jgi:hypothetical protein